MNAHGTVHYNQMSSFQQDKSAWENAIAAYSGSDPLELWFNYICWYEQNISLDSDNQYEAALGKCLSMYEYNETFKQDIRMVKLWMKYINLKPNPLNLFQVLYQRGVGTQCAIFYIAWAQFFIVANAFKQADSVYNLGFRAKAQPHNELDEAHSKFRVTVAQKMMQNDNVGGKKRTLSHMTEQQSPQQNHQQQQQQQQQQQHHYHHQQQQPLHPQQQIKPQQQWYQQQQQPQPQPQPQQQQQQQQQLQQHQQQQLQQHQSQQEQPQRQQQQSAAVSVIKKPRTDINVNYTASPVQVVQSSASPIAVAPASTITKTTSNCIVRNVASTGPTTVVRSTPIVLSVPVDGHAPTNAVHTIQQTPLRASPVSNVTTTNVTTYTSNSNYTVASSDNNQSYSASGLNQMVSNSNLTTQTTNAGVSTTDYNHPKYQSTSNRYYQSANNEQSNINNVITSSLNFVYCDTNYEEQSATSVSSDEMLGINIPPNFVRYARNDHEPWHGALFLEEPFEANRICKYPKSLVYPGNGKEFSLEEIRARKYGAHIEIIKEVNRKREMERARLKEQERIRMEKEKQRLAEIERMKEMEQERLRQVEQERLRRLEQERLKQAEMERMKQIEQERQRQAAEYERIRQAEQERARSAELQRIRSAELVRKRSEQDSYRVEQNQYKSNGYTTTTTTTTILNSNSEDIEEQIEASTIRFSTGNGLSKPKTITIKFRKEKPTAQTPELSKVPSPSPKPKKEKKYKPAKKHNSINQTPTSSNGSSNYYQTNSKSHRYDNNYHNQSNNIEDANLLLSIANMHSSSNEDLYATGPAKSQQYASTMDDSFSNSEFNTSYPGSTENSNSNFNFSASSTPIRSSVSQNYINESYSKSSTPHNFKILKKRTSNISYQNDDSMSSSISIGEQNSFFASENDEDLMHKRKEKALQTIETHLTKKVIDPFSSELCKAFLAKIGFPSMEHNSFYKLVNTIIPKLCNTKVAMLANVPYQIEKEVGRGSYGSVYKAINGNTGATVALKFQKPANNWELYICTEVRRKITDPDVLQGFMDISSAIVAPNASIFVSEFSQFGSLLDINNRIRQNTTKVMHESLVMHFSSQILMIVDHLHSCKIIHADIKPDNFLLMKVPNANSHAPSLRLIDFGCAIDMNFFEPNTQFMKRIETDGFTCTEMQDGRPWSYQTDIFCIAGTIHVMLFGEYMQTVKKFGQWEIKTKLPRYLKKHVWSELFQSFLNIKDIDHLPNLLDMKSKIDDELYNMESELQSQIRTLSNILYRR